MNQACMGEKAVLLLPIEPACFPGLPAGRGHLLAARSRRQRRRRRAVGVALDGLSDGGEHLGREGDGLGHAHLGCDSINILETSHNLDPVMVFQN